MIKTRSIATRKWVVEKFVSEEYFQLFLNEYNALSNIPDNQNIIKLEKAEHNNNGSGTLQFEFFPKGDFHEFVLNSVGFDERIARFYFKQLVNGLTHIHKHGYSHLDLKLENVIVDD